jgi:hypothetical protein
MNRLNYAVKARGALQTLLLVICAAVAAPAAHADTILMSQSTMVSGTFSSVHSFATTQAGTLTLKLENIAWPERLAALSCNLYDNKSMLGSLATTGEIRLELAAPGTFFSHLFAQSGGALDLGLFSLKVTFAPAAPTVPLPAGLWLLGSVCGIFGIRRHALSALRFLLGRTQFA